MDGQRSKIDVAFAEWMLLHLGYQDTEVGVHVQGGQFRQYRVSVHGRVYDSRWRVGNIIAVVALAAAAIIENTSWHTRTNTTSALVANGAGLLALAAFLVGYFGKKRTARHAWVQCKKAARHLSCRDVEKLRATVDDVRSNSSAKWVASNILLVSGPAGFDLEALKLAKSYGIECFLQVGSEFERARVGATDQR